MKVTIKKKNTQRGLILRILSNETALSIFDGGSKLFFDKRFVLNNFLSKPPGKGFAGLWQIRYHEQREIFDQGGGGKWNFQGLFMRDI